MRNKIIFKGSSNTLGLGLELELSKRYNDVDWLKENGVILPHEYTEEDYTHINQNRWPKLVCDSLNFKEYNDSNVNDLEFFDFLVYMMNSNKDEFNDVAHIFLEPQIFRALYKSNLYTPAEMYNLLKTSNDLELVQFIEDWITNFDESKELEKLVDIVDFLKLKYSEIEFHLIMWYGSVDLSDYIFEKLKDILVYFTINNKTSYHINELLTKNKLRVLDSAFCYKKRIDLIGNRRWKIGGYEDGHANLEAQSLIADNVINRIKNSRYPNAK